MHDLDRTQQFVESGSMELEADNEFGFEMSQEMEGEVNEDTEMELATELLSVNNEEELEEFIGDLFKKVVKGVKNFANSSTGKALGGMLKGVVKKALPVVGGALGSVIAPGVGTAIGSSLGGAAGNALGLELEGLSSEDQELEVSKTLVRLATEAARSAADSAGRGGDPTMIAREAIHEAAASVAPGLLSSSSGNSGQEHPGTSYSSGGGQGHHPRRRTGRWVRRGSMIVLYGV